MSPDSSATGMKRMGITSPCCGSCQRTSASAETMRPLAASMMGWKCRHSSPCTSARRSPASIRSRSTVSWFISWVKNAIALPPRGLGTVHGRGPRAAAAHRPSRHHAG